MSVEVGKDLAGGFEGGDRGGLLGAGVLNYLVDRGREVLVQFLGRTGDGGGRDREVAGQVGGALLEFGAPFAVGGTDVTVRISSRVVVFLLAAFLAGAFSGFSPAEASEAGASGAGALPGGVLSTEVSKTSGVSESVGSASAARLSTVIVTANSF